MDEIKSNEVTTKQSGLMEYQLTECQSPRNPSLAGKRVGRNAQYRTGLR